jgi:ferritin-like metal-binding protein YciE
MPTTTDKKLDDLFYDTLRDIYYAEKQLVKALPKMAKSAQDPKLKQGFEKHASETEGHVERLERVFEIIDRPARAKTCDAILGILEEGKSIMDEFKGAIALDAGLIAAGQAAEHYEIARYGTLRTWAQQLGYADAVKLLDQTLNEEKMTDKTLTQLAESGENAKAAA